MDIERISVPLLARLHPQTKNSPLYLKAGLVLHHALNIEFESESYQRSSPSILAEPETTQSTFKGKSDSSSGARAIVPDAVLGIGYELAFSNSQILTMELNYAYGLLGLGPDKDDFYTDTVYFSLGTLF